MDAQKALDATLAPLVQRAFELAQRIRSLREERNTHAAISKLPNEVLLEIFMVLMTCYPLDEWHQVAHVCRHWRDVAVGAPMLWTFPLTEKHQFTMLMLERSKTAELTIHLDSNTSSETVNAILKCADRIKTLEIAQIEDEEGEIVRDTNLLQDLLSGLTSSMVCPRLTKLVVCRIEDKWPCEAIQQLLQATPRLQDLHLECITLDWRSLQLHSMTHLYLEDIEIVPRMSVQQIVETIQQMPHLEGLALPLSKHLSPKTSTTQAKFIMASLRVLYIPESNLDNLVYFLKHLAFPRLRRLEIQSIDEPCGHDTFLVNHYPKLLPDLASAVKFGDFGVFECIAVLSYSVCLFMSGEEYLSPSRAGDLQRSLQSSHIRIHVPGPGRYGTIAPQIRLSVQLATDLLELSPSNFTNLISATIPNCCTQAEFSQLYGKPICHRLRKLAASADAASMLALTNAINVPSQSTFNTEIVPFPNLKSIFLATFFSLGRGLADSSSDDLENLAECLLNRCRAGHPLDELEMQQNDPTPDQFVKLQKAVTHLKTPGGGPPSESRLNML